MRTSLGPLALPSLTTLGDRSKGPRPHEPGHTTAKSVPAAENSPAARNWRRPGRPPVSKPCARVVGQFESGPANEVRRALPVTRSLRELGGSGTGGSALQPTARLYQLRPSPQDPRHHPSSGSRHRRPRPDRRPRQSHEPAKRGQEMHPKAIGIWIELGLLDEDETDAGLVRIHGWNRYNLKDPHGSR